MTTPSKPETHDHVPRDASDPVGKRLREEALATAPSFSPVLHERIMNTLRTRGLNGEKLDQSLAPSRWRLAVRIGFPLAVAAGLIVVAWFVLHTPLADAPRPRESVVVNMPLPAQLMAPMHQAISEPTQAYEEGKYGYLDKDARRLAIFVASQVPTFQYEASPTQPAR